MVSAAAITSPTWQNWAGNQSARPRRVITPRSADEVAEAVTAAGAEGLRVRMTGSGHSFTGAAVTDGLLPVEAGCSLRVLNTHLQTRGLALANMGDIQEQTVAGAIQTGTHGTGRDLASIAAQVAGLEMVLADGTITSCSAGSDVFRA